MACLNFISLSWYPYITHTHKPSFASSFPQMDFCSASNSASSNMRPLSCKISSETVRLCGILQNLLNTPCASRLEPQYMSENCSDQRVSGFLSAHLPDMSRLSHHFRPIVASLSSTSCYCKLPWFASSSEPDVDANSSMEGNTKLNMSKGIGEWDYCFLSLSLSLCLFFLSLSLPLSLYARLGPVLLAHQCIISLNAKPT